jgi:glycosyltransferase involved in cell wall biosynthesis
MRLALAMIVKGTDEEAQALRTCLRYSASHVDGIFVTITHKPGEERNKAVEEVAQLFNATISDFEWCNDFSAARNFNFSQVPKQYDYILWLDADDALRGGEKLKATIEANPKVDAFVLHYLYAFDEQKRPIVVHMKSQVIRNDGCAVWKGRLHEDLSPTRDLQTFFLKGIDRLHLSTEDRFESAKVRNLEVAEAQVKESPNDPRSYWNLGNSLKAIGRNEEALKAFDRFLESSRSDDEVYIVRLRRAEILWALGKKPEAIEECRYAIGTKPEFPDAYFTAGSLYLETDQFEKARDSYLMGLTKPKPYHAILVYNPRDYDYVPLKNLAKAYLALNFPQLSLIALEGCLKVMPEDEDTKTLVKKMRKLAKESDKVVEIVSKLRKIKDKEKLKRELAKLTPDQQAHPAVCNLRNTTFIKEESSGRDVAIYCGYTEETWTPATAKKKGIGGSEEAVIWLSRLLSERGWNVTVYNRCGMPQEFDGVSYKPFWMWNYRDKQDAVILWRSPKAADYEINSPKVFLDLHDVIAPGELTTARLSRINKIFVKSQFHRSLFPTVPDEKFVVVPNGIDPKVFEETPERDPYLLVNTSSPDRSLSALLDCYADVKKEVPEAKLKWAYGWGVFDVVHGQDAEVMQWKDDIKDQMKELGVEELGRISHPEVAKLYLQGNILAYPSEFAEIDCISLSKAMAAGAIPVTTDFSAMGEKTGYGGVFIHSEKTPETWCKPYQHDFSLEDPEKRKEWTRAVIEILKNPPSEEEREAMRAWARETFAWEKVADVWNQELSK